MINTKYFNNKFSLADYCKLLMVAQVEFSDSVPEVNVTKTNYLICERCKLYYNNQELNKQNLCQRCEKALEQFDLIS